MTNSQIIISEAIANGIYTKEEVEAILESGHMIPVHTFATWKSAGYNVKKANTLKSLLGFGSSPPKKPETLKRMRMRTAKLIIATTI